MRRLLLLVVFLLVLLSGASVVGAAPIEQMIGSNFVFRTSDGLCSATHFYAPERWVLTNYHCIETAITYVEQDEPQADGTVRKVKRITYEEITLSQPAYGPLGKVGELTLRAGVVAFSKAHDLAVLQILLENPGLPHVAKLPADDYHLRQGQTVYAIGNPVGMENTLTRGIVSHLYREHRWTDNRVARYVQTDATITGGSSGGALYDEDGFLVGVPAAGFRGVSINFAIPVAEVKAFLRAEGFAQAWDPTAPTRKQWLEERKRASDRARAAMGLPPVGNQP